MGQALVHIRVGVCGIHGLWWGNFGARALLRR